MEVELYTFLTLALDGVKCSAYHPCNSTLGEVPLVSIVYKDEWAPELVWTQWWREKIPFLPLPAIETQLPNP